MTMGFYPNSNCLHHIILFFDYSICHYSFHYCFFLSVITFFVTHWWLKMSYRCFYLTVPTMYCLWIYQIHTLTGYRQPVCWNWFYVLQVAMLLPLSVHLSVCLSLHCHVTTIEYWWNLHQIFIKTFLQNVCIDVYSQYGIWVIRSLYPLYKCNPWGWKCRSSLTGKLYTLLAYIRVPQLLNP